MFTKILIAKHGEATCRVMATINKVRFANPFVAGGGSFVDDVIFPL